MHREGAAVEEPGQHIEAPPPEDAPQSPGDAPAADWPAPYPEPPASVLLAASAGVGLAGDAATRKASPVFSGVLGYFPNALAAVAHVSKVGNDQHNPGLPLQWAFDKSSDEADALLRHLAEAGRFDESGSEPVRHAAKVAWRALALLERELLAAHPELLPGVSVTGFRR